MTEAANETMLESLDIFVGEWSIGSSFAPEASDAPRARTTFEWLPGRRFLIQRWEVEHPQCPGRHCNRRLRRRQGTLLQHYFDSRGVARVYEMSFADKVWTLERLAAPPDFSQHFTGTFGNDDDTIAGCWESSSDGTNWSPDFDLKYTRVR